MAYDFEFSGGVALDNEGRPVPGATGQVYQHETAGDPLTVLVAGVETTTIQTGSGVAVIQSFHADYEIVYADFGAGRFRVNSWDGIRSYVSEAAETALDASNSAAEIATRTMQLKGNAAAGVSFWGAFTEGSAPGAADGVAVGDLGVLLS